MRSRTNVRSSTASFRRRDMPEVRNAPEDSAREQDTVLKAQLSMPSQEYSLKYFDPYLNRGRVTGALWGEKRSIYSYWAAYLKRCLPVGARVLETGCGLGYFGARIQSLFS